MITYILFACIEGMGCFDQIFTEKIECDRRSNIYIGYFGKNINITKHCQEVRSK